MVGFDDNRLSNEVVASPLLLTMCVALRRRRITLVNATYDPRCNIYG